MAIATRNSTLWADLETTYGSGTPALTLDDGILVINPTFTPQFEMLEPEERPGTSGQHASHLGRYWSQLAFDTLLRSSGTAHAKTTEPKLGRLLQACGFTMSSGGTDPSGYYRYSLSSTLSTHKSLFAEAYFGDSIAGIKHSIKGLRGTFNFSFDSGQLPVCSFMYKGIRIAATSTPLPASTFETTQPMTALSVAIAGLPVASATINLLHFEFDLGREPVMGEDAQDVTGVTEFYSTNWNIKGNIVVEALPGLTVALETELLARTGKTLIVTCDQPDDADEHCTFKFVNAKWENYEYGDKDGIRTITIPFTAFESSGDDSLVIQFGAVLA